jgi:hypothetical protein
VPLLQWVDSGPARDFPRRDTHRVQEPLLPPAIWEPVIREHTLLRTFPGFFCGPADNHRLSQEFQMLASRVRVPVNTVFMARQVDDCEAERALVDSLKPGERELVVYLPPFHREHARLSFPNPAACRDFSAGIACSLRFLEQGLVSSLAQGNAPSYFGEEAVAFPRLTPVDLGSPLVFREGNPGAAMLYTGWYAPEPEGVWMRGGVSQVWVLLREKPVSAQPLRLRFRAKAYLSARHPQKRLEVFANGEPLGERSLDTWESVEHKLRIPADLARRDGPLRIRFVISPVSSPLADGVSQDPRELGIQLQQLILDAPPADDGG